MKFPILLLLLCLSLIGCESRRSPVLHVNDGGNSQSVELKRDTDHPERYLLEEPLVVTRTDRAFSLRYRGGGSGAALRILGEDERELAAKTLPRANEAAVYIPLQRGRIVRGFWLDVDQTIPFEFLEAEISDAFSGYENSGGLLTAGTSIQEVNLDGRTVRLAIDATEQLQEEWQIAVVLETVPPFDYADFRYREAMAEQEGGSDSAEAVPEPRTRRTSVVLRLQSGDSSVSFRHNALAGRHKLFLYSGMVPFKPQTLSIEPMGGAAVWLQSLQIARISAEPAGDLAAGQQPGSLQPLPADPGALLLYDPDSWRQTDYELFAWSRFPRILIMDTASYAVQSRFFKRLAFFVEKPGYRGRLVSDEEFEDLHGFNAHDYRAEDLARFFQTAREQLFALNPEEELLEQILLANGIIRDAGVIGPGEGGILSISRSSYPTLRRHLLTHECAHGLFFSLPEFRAASFEAWERLSQAEQEYWKLFFRWVGYDTEDLFLTVNEYQAYLFQQPRSGVRYYFSDLTASRLISRFPGEASWVRELIRSDPERFTRAFDDLEPSLVEIAGVEGGRVIELESDESK